MKKLFRISLVLLLLVSFGGCTGGKDGKIQMEFDHDGKYTGFENLPETYSQEQAEKDGCYVFADFKPSAGEKSWERFVKESQNGHDAKIRIVYFHEQTTRFQDLYHIDGYYRVFNSDSPDMKDRKFSCLHDARGRLQNAAKDGRAVVITDDTTLTYVQIMFTFFSSDFHYRDTIAPFELIFIE